MELNVIDLSREGSQGQERVKVKKASGGDVQIWNEVLENRGAERRVRPEGQRNMEGERRPRLERQVSLEGERGPRPERRSVMEGERRPGTESRSVREVERRPRPERQSVREGERRPRPQRQTVREGERDPRTERRAVREMERRTGSQERPHRPRQPRTGTYAEEMPARRPRPADPRARQERIRRRRRRRRKQLAARLTVLLVLVGLIVLLIFALFKLITGKDKDRETVQYLQHNVKEPEPPKESVKTLKPFLTEDFLTVNEYSRPGEALEAVNNIFVHYTANKGTSAAQNRSYFENLGITGETSASAHFIIGYDGEIIQCIPLDEIGYAVMGRNYDSISIECCYLQDDGKFTEETYQSLIRLCAWLLDEYNLTPEDMKRHYDEGGKKCPLYFTEHVEAWEQFKRDLDQYLTDQKSI